ncbi:mechanosensitive ion channel [Sulfurimonas aquatica]|uniref:Mechanosensitive ion channel n=1 Tax=Sulfurimonas aquatica TaxID=2672570 RepID=A0A975GDS5_9BACT|nr:mechanosensitive ion channel family protein [Sulfurimonas aquatica]QSZ42668.1 mechanosensitive ion channel [Sulfurimonas aquatica]
MLDTIYLNNSLQNWLLAFAIAIGAVIIGKVLYWVIQKTLKVYTKGTSNDLDFIFIDMIEEPLSLAITILGFWIAVSVLTFSEGVDKFIGSIFYFLIIFNIAWFATRLFDAVVEKYVAPKVKESDTDLDDILLPIIRKLVNTAIWAITIIIGVDNAGYNVTTMITGLGIGGLVFALAAKDAVSNLFGGFIIFSDKPFNINDRIIISGHEGYVREIGLRSTKLETLEGRIVTMPNSNVTDNPVLNVSKENGRKVKFSIGLTYDTSVENMQLAKDILVKILQEHEAIRDEVVAFNSFGDFSLNIMVIYWIRSGSAISGTNDEVNMRILKEFNEKKLSFAFPTQSIIIEKN